MAYIRPYLYNDPNSKWVSETNAYDGDTGTYAYDTAYNNWLELIFVVPIYCDKIRLYAVRRVGVEDWNPVIDIDVYYDGGWHDVFEGMITKNTWVERTISGGPFIVSKARIKSTYDAVLRLKEFEFNQETAVGPVNLTSNCKGWWKMNDDEVGDNTILDSSGNSHNGTLVDKNGDVDTHDASTTGKINKAIDGDRTDEQKIVVPHHADLNPGTGDFSLSLWVKQSDCSGGQRRFFCKGDAADYNYWCGFYTNGMVYMYIDDSVNTDSLWSLSALDDNAWHHLVWANDRDVGTQLFVDGVRDGVYSDTTVVGNIIPDEVLNMMCDYAGTGSFMDGLLDNMMYFNRALTQREIDFLYNNGDGTESLVSFARPLVGSSLVAGRGGLAV